MRIGVDEWSYHNSMLIKKMSIEDLIERCGELGVDGVGFDYFMLPEKYRKEPEPIKELLEQNNLELVFGFSMPFALPDMAFKLMENKKDEMFDLAHDFKCKVVRVIGGVVLPNPVHKPIHVTVSRGSEVRNVARRLKSFVEDAALEGLTVALENHSDYKTDEMLQILDLVEHDALKITFDTGNALYHREDPVETAGKLAPYAVYTHIKDMKYTGPFLMSVPLGQGEVDVHAIVNILKKNDYQGLYSIEVDLAPWQVEEEDTALQDSIEVLLGYDKDYVEEEPDDADEIVVVAADDDAGNAEEDINDEDDDLDIDDVEDIADQKVSK